MKILRNILLWIMGLVLVFVIQGLVLIYIYEKEIKVAAINRLNENINTPVKVGEIDVSLFEHFPFVSLTFPDVLIYESGNNHKNVMLSAKEISLLFNIWDFYKQEYVVRKLYINHLVWNSEIDANGISNFNILKKDSASNSKSSGMELLIEDIIIKNSSILHVDKQSKRVIRTDIDFLHAKGKFSDKTFDLQVESDLKVQALLIENISYLRNKKIKIKSGISVDLINNRYAFSNSDIEIERLKLLLNGFINYSDQNKFIDMNFAGKDLDIQSFLSLLPVQYRDHLKEYTSKGEMYFDATIKGKLGDKNTPRVQLKAGLKNAKVEVEKKEYGKQTFENVYFDLTYDNYGTSQFNDDEIRVQQLTAKYHNNPLKASFYLKNFQDPSIEFSLKTAQSIPDIQKLLPVSKVNFEKGNIEIDVLFKGRLTDFKNGNTYNHVQSQGSIIVTDAKLTAQGYSLPIDQLNTSLVFQKSDLRINHLSTTIGNSDFRINGYFRNLLSYILIDDQDLEIDASIHSDHIDLKELLSSSTSTSDAEPYKLKINPKLLARLQLKIKQLSFDPFIAANLEGAMNIKDQIITTDYLGFQSQKGLIFAKINFDTKNPNSMPMDIDLNVKQADISNIFKEFNNFGLDILTHKHLKGDLSTSMILHLVWNEQLITDYSKLTAKGKVLIENGQLIQFQPMLALSKYIDVNELSNMKFSTLENTIEVKDQIIDIPMMDIKSNAINLSLSGTHKFDNQIDYHLKILLSEILKKKSKRLGDERFGEIEDDGTGKTTLFIRMYGNVANPQFSLDQKMIRKKIADDIKQERQEVKQILKDEFGSMFKKDKEFKEQMKEDAAEWEKDIPQPKNNSQKTISSGKPADSLTKKKSGMQRLKDKLKEPVEENE